MRAVASYYRLGIVPKTSQKRSLKNAEVEFLHRLKATPNIRPIVSLGEWHEDNSLNK